MKCPRCEARGTPWVGDDPICAFPNGVFDRDNWNCATMNDLRDLCSWDLTNSNEDQHACLLSGVDNYHVVLSWYKRRGRTERAWTIGPTGIHPLTLVEAETILAIREVCLRV